MAALNPYLNFGGNTEEVFNFYKSVFGGEFSTFMRFSDVPAGAMGGEQNAADANMLMHVALPIGKGSVLMGSDKPAAMGSVTKGDNSWISLDAESKEEADKLFNGLSAGGMVMMPLQDTFWGAYFGMFADKFGTQWMINCEQKK